MKFKSLTNSRPPAKEYGEEVIARVAPPSSKSGSFVLTEKVAKKLGVTIGDYVDFIENPEKAGEFYIGKGYDGKGQGEPGEDGKPTDLDCNGNKLGKTGSLYVLSSANVWNALGSKTENIHYSLAEEATVVETPFPNSPVNYYLLTEVSRETPTPRATSKKKSDTPAENQAAEVAQVPGESAGQGQPADIEAAADDISGGLDEL